MILIFRRKNKNKHIVVNGSAGAHRKRAPNFKALGLISKKKRLAQLEFNAVKKVGKKRTALTHCLVITTTTR